MSFENLGLNLSAMSSVDSKQAGLQSALDTKIIKDSTIRQNDIVSSDPFKLFPNNTLLTCAPQTVFEKSSSDDLLSMGIINAEENRNTSFDVTFDPDNGIITAQVLRSPASSLSLDTSSCYSCGLEEEASLGSESSFSSMFEEDCKENSIAKESEKEFGFDSAALSFDETINRISSAFDCDDEEVEAGDFEDIPLSPRCFEGEEANQSFNSLFDGEDIMMKEIENFDESQETAKDSSNFKLTEQEKQEYLVLSLRRHARAIQNNPHLSHLFL